jgi:hypothetical protein
MLSVVGGLECARYNAVVPVVSIFFGIVIRMFYREHGVAHFHAEYQGQQATFTLEGKVLAGALSSRTATAIDQGVGGGA